MFCFRAETLVVACCCLIVFNRHSSAEDESKRPSQIHNPHYLVELATFVRLPVVRRELGLTDQQIFDVESIADTLKRRFETYKERHNPVASSEERREYFLQYQADRTILRQQWDAAFRPDQLKRVKELASQHLTRDPDDAFGILGRTMKQELEVTDKQARALQLKSVAIAEKLRQREAELKLELERLRTRLRSEVVESLDPAQRDSLKVWWGDLLPIAQ